MEKNKKTLIVYLVGVLLLIAAIVGVSIAMYNFSATGTKNNVIQTGSVSIAFNKKSIIELTNQYPVSDAKGVTLDNGKFEYDIVANLSGSMTLNYKLALSDITPGTTLTSNYIKFNLTKSVGDAIATYVLGTETTGVALSGYDNGQTIATGSFTATGSDHYVLRAWVADNYKLSNQTVSGTCVNGTGNTAETCTGIWKQANQTTSESFTFKVKVEAEQS